MKTLKVNAYEITELEGKAKDKAMDWLREGATDHDWYSPVIEGWKENLENVGFPDADIEFSGFWSQGDGASFTCESLDMEKIVKRFKSELDPSELTGSVNRWQSHYVHSQTIDAELEAENQEYSEAHADEIAELEKKITEDARRLSDEICRDLEKYHDDITSEAALIEDAQANEYLFDKYGTPVHHLEA